LQCDHIGVPFLVLSVSWSVRSFRGLVQIAALL
jgi:hypothetical protein